MFIGNEAKATGGAIDAGAGFDKIINTSFKGNTAGAGGALTLAGTTILHNYTFVETRRTAMRGPRFRTLGCFEYRSLFVRQKRLRV